jgi:hypothetical protein
MASFGRGSSTHLEVTQSRDWNWCALSMHWFDKPK